ncbi:molybdate ABC transporter substrate-binding protein [Desulfospira joergensenii]|uniref:molybdate ABC transporter substrate-binding protein n=1 Tax=Desulfospira joergensenii TaxID=53329 RepID=UPI0003B451AD|nr:molybdate ABC transporter substrate-binding protein [Desulfospira joergensenii]
MNPKPINILIAAALLLLTCILPSAEAQSQNVTVFAAASTTNAVTDIAELYKKTHPTKVRLSFASSSTLAKQIEKGAPADVYLSANPKWMNYLEEKGAIVKESRKDLLGNRLVLIAPAGSSIGKLIVDSHLDLAGLLSGGRLSMGDPDHVPAGMYGKKAMTHLGYWEKIEDKIARAKDVRAALVLVERAETPLGQVYATDAAISSKVRVVGLFPEESHPKIVYPVALVKKSPEARAFLDFIQSAQAAEIFKKYGFSIR